MSCLSVLSIIPMYKHKRMLNKNANYKINLLIEFNVHTTPLYLIKIREN